MNETKIPVVLPEPRDLRGAESLLEIYKRQMTEAGELLREFKRAPLQLVADDVGTGKTWVAMMVIFSSLHEALEAANCSNPEATVKPQRAIVIAPTHSVQAKWAKELRRFTKQCLPDPSGVSVNSISSKQDFLELYAKNTGSVGRPCSRFDKELTEPAPLQRLLGCKDGRRAFVVYLHDECVEQGRRDERKLVEKWKKTVNAYSAYRAAFRAVLPQEEVLRLAGELLAYGHALGRKVWMDVPYDANAVTSDEAGRGHFGTRLSDLNESVFSENIPDEQAEGRIDRIVCTVSALWRAHERRVKKEKFPDRRTSCESVIVSDFYRDLSAWLKSGRKKRDERTKFVQRLLAHILHEGLDPDRLSRFKNALTRDSRARFEEAEREFATDDVHIEANGAACLVKELAAFSRRVDALVRLGDERRTKQIVLGKAKLDLYSPAGVFKDLSDLRCESKCVDKVTFEKRLATFVAPVYKANVSASYSICEYVAHMLCELAAFECAPDRVGSVFWYEARKTRIVDVVNMGDLNVSGGEQPGLDEPIAIAVVDEAHNWHRGHNGAEGFETLLSGRAERRLLLTATPLQLEVSDLNNIFEAVLKNAVYETDSDFARAYKALFADGGVTGSLKMVREKSEKFAQELKKLAENDEAKVVLERAAALVADDATSTEKWRVWSALAGRGEEDGMHSDVLNAGESPAMRDLAEAALSYKEAQEAILKHLRHIVVKTRSRKFLDNERTIPSRRWYVGVETERGVGNGFSNTFENARRPCELHAAPGIVPGETYLWTNLIGMRLTTLDGEDGARTRPRLLLGLPSSYEAYKKSAQARGLQATETVESEQNQAIDRAFYTSLLNQKLDALSDTHPKVRRTVEIVINAWRRGEKTLVFAERQETIAALEKSIKKGFDRELQGEISLERLVRDALGALATPLDERSVIGATLDAAQRFYVIKFESSECKGVDVWRCALLGKKHILSNQEEYDARAAWIVMKALEYATNAAGETVGKAINDALYALRSESRLNPNLEGAEIKLYDAVRTVTGDTENRNVLLETFNSPFPPLVLVCSTVGQEGVDMHRFCRTLVLHDLSWNPAKLEQRVGRLDRVASLSSVRKAPVEIYVPYIAEGYDAWKFRRVLRRAELQEALFGLNEGVPECDIDLEDKSDETKPQEEKQEAKREYNTPELPDLGNLMRGFFEMDLSVRSRTNENGLIDVAGTDCLGEEALDGGLRNTGDLTDCIERKALDSSD